MLGFTSSSSSSSFPLLHHLHATFIKKTHEKNPELTHMNVIQTLSLFYSQILLIVVKGLTQIQTLSSPFFSFFFLQSNTHIPLFHSLSTHKIIIIFVSNTIPENNINNFLLVAIFTVSGFLFQMFVHKGQYFNMFTSLFPILDLLNQISLKNNNNEKITPIVMDLLNCLSFEIFEEFFLGELMNGSVICVF